MRAVVTEACGALPLVRDVPEPQPGPGELLVRVRASSLNAVDLAIVGGSSMDTGKHHFPMVLGRDFAGIVEGLGDGAKHFAVGDAVFGVVVKTGSSDGGFAELVTVPEAEGVARLPQGMDVVQAGALGFAGLAALASVRVFEPEGLQLLNTVDPTVLISGATGGVGSFATQMAARRGLHVIATARDDESVDFVGGLGASDAVDYTGDIAAQVRALRPGGVEAVLHYAGDGMALADLIVPGGRLVSTLGLGHGQLAGRHLAAIDVMEQPSEEALDGLAALVVLGALRVPITRTYALDDAPQAFVEFAGTLGKAAVVIG